MDGINRGLLPLIGWLGCGCGLDATTAPDQLDVADPGPPTITEVDWSCDADLQRWRLDIDCDAWSNGGRLYLSEDFVYLEEHAIKSRKAASDGSKDELRLDLSIATDWREVTSGKSTAFGCSQSPNGLFVIYDRENNTSDCRRFGPQIAEWPTVEGVPGCDTDWSDTGLIPGN